MLDRFIIAIERVAGALEKMAEPAAEIIQTIDTAADAAVEAAGAAKAAGASDAGAAIAGAAAAAATLTNAVDYDALVAEGKRDALLVLCSERNIEIVKGTKTPTLAKMLKTYDAAHPAPAAAPAGGPANEPDPFSADAGAADADPFAADAGAAAAAVEATLEDAKAALQAIQAAKGAEVGNPIIKGILKEITGSEVFSGLTTVAHFAAAIAKAKEVK